MASRQFIGSWSVAVPPFALNQSEGERFLREHYGDKIGARSLNVIGKVFNHPSVQQRYFAFSDPSCLINENPDERIERFTTEAVKLSSKAAIEAMDKVGVEKDEITGVVVNTCTGYICPGLSTYLVEGLKLKRTARVYDLVGSGCGGAIPNLQLSQALLKEGNGDKILSVSVEICSATFQMADNLSLIISNAIFGDGAAAAVVWNQPRGLALLSSVSHHAPEYRDDIRFVYRNGRLHNQLSLRLPKLVGKAVGRLVADLLQQNRLQREDIAHWVIHPGGENIIAAIKSELNLSEEHLQPTRDVLANYGNMSSATVWFILDRVKDKIMPGEYLVVIAFGAGFSSHAYLLQSGS
ncbi:MAG: type III polyketide synthase [Planctomycetes bacterium]|nr:type III polyketide synthase [Planctomycetota bacterium]